MLRYQKLNKLSVTLFELNFCHDQNKWKHIKIFPIEITKSKTKSDNVIDLLIYKKHFVFIKKFNVFSGKKILFIFIDHV